MHNLSELDIKRLLTRGVSEVIVKDELVSALKTGKPLRLKEGFDPSFPDIHLGHMVGLKKLREFQDMGHQVVLIVGDWTAQIGDPSGASVTRPMLTAEQVKINAKTYMEQFFKIVDKDKTEVRWQSEWFGNFNLADVIKLTSKFTIAQILARDDFSKRYNANQPITITEFLYPLLQAYDSVAINADVEFGGTDQKFNLLVGRELQTMLGQRAQQVLMVPLLVGTDGVHKMSKSLGNYIGVTESPENMFGKVMSIPDNIIINYFELITDVSDEELNELKSLLGKNEINPMELKKRLGKEIVTKLHSKEAAIEAENHFSRVVQNKEIPDEIEECLYNLNSEIDLKDLLVKIKMAKSRSDAGRLIEQGAVSINGQTVTVNGTRIEDGSIVKVGKRRFAKLINSDIIK
ncbi:MAG TPA: tyrosine--tRNA ligase [Dehalococcoidia bacterium]|nr:tyrosine--tRNA ligase [Dehalococcoidia bacterium]